MLCISHFSGPLDVHTKADILSGPLVLFVCPFWLTGLTVVLLYPLTIFWTILGYSLECGHSVVVGCVLVCGLSIGGLIFGLWAIRWWAVYWTLGYPFVDCFLNYGLFGLSKSIESQKHVFNSNNRAAQATKTVMCSKNLMNKMKQFCLNINDHEPHLTISGTG